MVQMEQVVEEALVLVDRFGFNQGQSLIPEQSGLREEMEELDHTMLVVVEQGEGFL